MQDVTWRWQWVPAPGAPDAQQWQDDTAAVFVEWTADGLRDVEPALTPEAVGAQTAQWLRSRADDCPPGARVAWGAGYVTADRPRWAPVVVTIELRTPRAADAGYLMDEVGARGAPGDARRPTVDYLTTEAGDGVRVAALVRGPGGAASCRVDAAVRVDVPAYGDEPATSVDVLASTRTGDLTLFGTLGAGVDDLLHLVAGQCLPGPDGTPDLVLLRPSANDERGTP